MSLRSLAVSAAIGSTTSGTFSPLLFDSIPPTTTSVTIVEAARERVERHEWAGITPGLRVTVSGGVAYEPPAEAVPTRPPVSAEQQLLRADSLLYTAKQSGRNAVAYRENGRVKLAGPAAGRRAVSDSRVLGYY